MHKAIKAVCKTLLQTETPYSTIQKNCKTNVLEDYVLTDRKTANYVVKKSKERELVSFEGSKDNILRSKATCYSAGVMGKKISSCAYSHHEGQ